MSKHKKADLPFTPAEFSERQRLICCVQAWTKHGSSHFGLTAPKPLLVQDINGRLEGTLRKFRGQEIYVEPYRAVETKIENVGRDKKVLRSIPAQVQIAENVIAKFERDYKKAIASGIRSIVWDKANELWDVLRLSELEALSHVGQEHYGVLNRKMKDWVALATESDVNLLMLHDLGDEYAPDPASGRGQATGRAKRIGWKWAAREAQVIVEISRVRNVFTTTILDNGFDPDLNGWECKNATFADVATAIFDDTEASDWE